MHPYQHVLTALLLLGLGLPIPYVHANGECPIKRDTNLDSVSLEELEKQKTRYEQMMNDPRQAERTLEIVPCYGVILDIEIQVSFLNKRYKRMFEASQKLLGLDPSDAKGVFYLALAYHFLETKPVPIKRIKAYVEGAAKRTVEDAFLREVARMFTSTPPSPFPKRVRPVKK